MKRTITRNARNSNNSNSTEKDSTMKRTIARNSNNSNNSNSNEKDSTMRKITRNSNNSNSNEKESTMKRTSRNNSTTTEKDPQKAAALAALAALGIDVAALFGKASEQASEPEKSMKADRLYEIPTLGADFTKSGIYAAPKSDNAVAYMAEAKSLCADTLESLTAPIASEVKAIAEKAEKDGGANLKDDLIRLSNSWKIPPQSMRVIMQLCAPVVCACNPETDEIARRVYSMAKANSLMGSACNTLMYSKAADKAAALPFKRVAHNLTALGLDFSERASVEKCDFCEDDEDFEELVRLCDMWLKKCEHIAPKDPAPQKSERGKKASASASASEDKKAAALAALAALGIDAKTLFSK